MESRRGFGMGVRSARIRPSNTTARGLLADDRFTGVVLDFLRATGAGAIKAGVVLRSRMDSV